VPAPPWDRDAIRTRWDELQRACDEEYVRSRNTSGGPWELSRHYSLLATDDRAVVDELLAEWVLDEDDLHGRQYDAIWLIDEYGIQCAVPALRELAERCEFDDSPRAPYQWAKANRTLGALRERRLQAERGY
jgi:hypothetical protein